MFSDALIAQHLPSWILTVSYIFSVEAKARLPLRLAIGYSWVLTGGGWPSKQWWMALLYAVIIVISGGSGAGAEALPPLE
jgi:hypothetical protein